MFSATLLLALLTAHSTLIAPSPSPATGGSIQQPSADVQPQGGSNAITANPLYVITSAYIHQYDGPPTAGTKIKARQAIDAQPVTNNTLPAANDNPSDYSTNSGPAMPRPSKMENFNLTVASGAGHSPGVHCNLTWDAGTANSATRDHIANETFSCDDGQTKVRMERRNVTPQYGFYVFVQMPNIPRAAWMVKDLGSDASKTAGWTVNGTDAVFSGTLYLTQDANQTLADFLNVPA